MHNTRPERRQKRCANRTCLRLSFRFTEPPHRATQVKQPGQGDRSPILVPAGHTPPTRGSRPHSHHPAPVAQWIEQVPSKHLAAGSSPAGGTPSGPSFGRVLFAGQAWFPVSGGGAGRTPDGVGARPAVSGCFRVSAGGCGEYAEKFSAPGRGWVRQLPRPLNPSLQVVELPVDAAGVRGQEHGDAVACPLGHGRGRDAGVEPVRQAGMPEVVYAATERCPEFVRSEHVLSSPPPRDRGRTAARQAQADRGRPALPHPGRCRPPAGRQEPGHRPGGSAPGRRSRAAIRRLARTHPCSSGLARITRVVPKRPVSPVVDGHA